MYKIGEFSKITQITVKTLHYYDGEGILKASERLENGYRLYTNEDFERAKKILFLRDLDFSIQEIKDVLNHVETNEELQYFLQEKKEMIEKKIQTQNQLVKRINTYLLPNTHKEEAKRTYQIGIKEIKEDEVATMRFLGSYPSVGKYLRRLYKYVKSNNQGAPYVYYYDDTPIKNRRILKSVFP